MSNIYLKTFGLKDGFYIHGNAKNRVFERMSSLHSLQRRLLVMTRHGWAGGFDPSVAASVQFTALGPLFHFYKGSLGLPTAVILTGVTESILTYSTNTRNVEIAAYTSKSSNTKLPPLILTPIYKIWGAGILLHVLRNIFGVAGLRSVSNSFQPIFESVINNQEHSRILSNFSGSLVGGMISTPVSQLYNFAVISDEYRKATVRHKPHIALSFLLRNYVKRCPGNRFRLSPIALRDLCMRSIYSASVFTTYAAIESFVSCKF